MKKSNKSLLKDFFSDINYPELLALFGIILTLLSTPVLFEYFVIFLSLLVLGLIVLIGSWWQKTENFVLDLLMVSLLAIILGVLQLNFLPSLVIWLLLFNRILFASKQYTALLALVGLFLSSVVLMASKMFLPPLSLEANVQNLVNQIALFTTALIMALQLWRLLSISQYYQKQYQMQQERMLTLVSVTNKLTRFLPPQVWQPIVSTNQAVEVVNQRKKLTIFFSDIAGFTKLSDDLSPDHLSQILNTYFDRMTQIVLKYQGTLDKFIGDGMLCYFGDSTNLSDKENAMRCVNMALEMRREMRLLRQQWQSQGFDGLYVRIGINTGYCHMGNFGSPGRMTYTIIGREANLASRLESAAQKGQILISKSTFDLICQNYHCSYVGELNLKGLTEPVAAWEILDPEVGESGNEFFDKHMSGFSLQINFRDIKNYDKNIIINDLQKAIKRLLD